LASASRVLRPSAGPWSRRRPCRLSAQSYILLRSRPTLTTTTRPGPVCLPFLLTLGRLWLRRPDRRCSGSSVLLFAASARAHTRDAGVPRPAFPCGVPALCTGSMRAAKGVTWSGGHGAATPRRDVALFIAIPGRCPWWAVFRSTLVLARGRGREARVGVLHLSPPPALRSLAVGAASVAVLRGGHRVLGLPESHPAWWASPSRWCWLSSVAWGRGGSHPDVAIPRCRDRLGPPVRAGVPAAQVRLAFYFNDRRLPGADRGDPCRRWTGRSRAPRGSLSGRVVWRRRFLRVAWAVGLPVEFRAQHREELGAALRAFERLRSRAGS